MRKFFVFAILVSFVLVTFCAPIVLKASDVHNEGYPTVEAIKMMGKTIELMTNGKYKIEVYVGGQLGSEKEVIEQTIMGAIHIARVSVAPLQPFYDPIGVYAMPYLFRDAEHYWKVLEGPVGEQLLKDMEKIGLIGLCYYDAGARSFYTKKPVQKPEDLKGMKIRVQQNAIMIALMGALGATGVPMGPEEIYTAIQTGIVDGAENNPPSYYEFRHFEVAPYYCLDGHTRIPEIVLINKAFWDKLTAEEKLIFKTAAIASVQYERLLWNQWEESALEAVKKAGAQVFVPDVSAFQKAVQSMYDKYPQYKELIQKIQATK
ncbi:MAG TPA: TRAP transporter substrate-binding protein [Pseudothermotoga sp.]|uniref:TRAP transporter substrate-binding protein n=1 Tax=Thermotoga profunda TaxID=1508420 RepID=UPI00059706FE|nr:TRAP transporter substrate-binding protein [Thermotoga profunda]